MNGKRASIWSSEEALAGAIADGRRRAAALTDSGVPLSQLYEQLLAANEESSFLMDASARPAAGRRRIQVDTAGAPARGPRLAPVTIVVFSSLVCVACAELANTLKRVMEAHPGQVRLLWKHLVPPAPHNLAATAAELSVAANAQGRFWELHDLALRSRFTPAHQNTADLEALAAAAGVDLQRYHREQLAGALRPVVDRAAAEARRIGVPFAPSLLVNGLPLVGAPAFETIDRLVRSELDVGVLERLKPDRPRF